MESCVRSVMRMKDRLIWVSLLLLGLQLTASAQNPPALNLETGKDIYETACLACHGPGGKGQPESTLGFEKPPQFPDFSDCNGSTRERLFDWKATIHEGGPGRGWSEIMPSFAE